jgi:hypothetical protein
MNIYSGTRFLYIIIVTAFLAGGLVVSGAGNAHAEGFLDRIYNKLFNKDDGAPKPEDTLIAPFAEQDRYKGTVIYDNKYVPLERAETSLNLPHRTSQDISLWLSRALSEVFSVDPESYDDHLVHLSSGMDAAGLEDFKKFMVEKKYLDVLRDNKLILKGLIEGEPVAISQGELSGRYRWLYEVNITLSMMGKLHSSYEDIPDKLIEQNVRVVVRTQLGRVAEGGIDGIVIESLNIRAISD